MKFTYVEKEYYLQKQQSLLFGSRLVKCVVKQNGIFVNKVRNTMEGPVSKKELLDLSNIKIYVEMKPEDKNRHKAINPNWLMWSDSQQVSEMEQRICISAEEDQVSKVFVFKLYKARQSMFQHSWKYVDFETL